MAKATHAAQARTLQDIPSIGPAAAGDLRALGITEPAHLVGRDPYAMYDESNRLRGVRQDPCVCDTFIAAVRFMEGGPPVPWWHHTAERKRHFAAEPAPGDR